MSALTPLEMKERLFNIKERITLAAKKSGRAPEEITLLGVSKTFPAALVRGYVQAGLFNFGESYIQEAKAKISELADLGPQVSWHFIGHLQTNKAKYAAPLFKVIHSVDSLELAEALNHRASTSVSKIDIYIQVNVSGELSKSGLDPEKLPSFLDGLTAFSALNPQGLMTMPPYDPDPEVSRPHFAALRILRDRYAPNLPGLSMGMSGDFETAIEEGATIVRIGTSLFGER